VLSQDVLPDIIFTTPPCLLNNFNKLMGLISSLNYIVFDEADMLFTGAYKKDAVRVIERLKNSEEKSFKKAIHNQWDFRSKQFIFSAATYPKTGRHGIHEIFRKYFPDLKYISTDLLHHRIPGTKTEYHKYDNTVPGEELRNEKIVELLKANPNNKTLIFCNATSSALSLNEYLQKGGIMSEVFASNVHAGRRQVILKRFRNNAISVVVCTDMASRGIDFTLVSHVIQAEFPTSSIDYLHRIGRTSRAGHVGTVHSFYSKDDESIVKQLRQKEHQNEDFASTFKIVTRNRNLRKQQPKKHKQQNSQQNNKKTQPTTKQ